MTLTLHGKRDTNPIDAILLVVRLHGTKTWLA
jgi:hypothetical protein